MTDLLFTLGLDVSGLKTSARVAKEQADDIKRSFKGIKDVVSAGGIGLAVVSFFRSVIDNAMNAKGVIDRNTAAVREFGKGLDELKGYAVSAGTTILGTLNRIGSTLGEGIRGNFEYIKGFFTTAGSMQERLAAAAKAYNGYIAIENKSAQLDEEARTRGAKIREELEKQKSAREANRAEAQRLADAERKFQLDGMTAQERRNALANEYLAKSTELETFTGSEVDRQKKINEFHALGLEYMGAQRAVAEESNKIEKERADRLERIKKLRFEMLSPEQQITELTKIRDGLEKQISEGKAKRQDTSEVEIKLLGVEKDLAAQRLTIEMKIREEEEKRLKAKKEADARARFAGNFSITGRADSQLSDADLALKKRNLQDALFQTLLGDQIVQGLANGSSMYVSSQDPLKFFKENQLAGVEAEMRRRAEVRRNASFFGESAALRMSGLSEQEFNDILRGITEQQQVNRQLAANVTTLTNLFRTGNATVLAIPPRG